MFDTIILLSGEAEQCVLPKVLLGHNPHLSVIPAGSSAELDAIGSEVFRRARLIGFATPAIVPQTILTQLGYGAFNFHPGPPAYPGWAPAHFALYNRETEFGATAQS
jgi:methionyl-tRNA formyltransferase